MGASAKKVVGLHTARGVRADASPLRLSLEVRAIAMQAEVGRPGSSSRLTVKLGPEQSFYVDVPRDVARALMDKADRGEPIRLTMTLEDP